MASDAFDQISGALGFGDTVFGVFGDAPMDPLQIERTLAAPGGETQLQRDGMLVTRTVIDAR